MSLSPGSRSPIDPHRRVLGEAFAAFLREIMQASLAPADSGRRAVVARYRRALEAAALHGIEVPLLWSALAAWSECGKERIGFFARALDCQLSVNRANPPRTPKQHHSDLHLRAKSLFEIGRIHFHEGDPTVAGEFFARALPLARACDAWRARCQPHETHDDRLEGRIMELVLQLPDENETSGAAW